MPSADPMPAVIGWDVGGAHLKACLVEGGVVRDIAQWRSPLWQGLHHLDMAIAQARARWSTAGSANRFDRAEHAATMTGEMVDLFATREQGVQRLASHLAEALGGSLRLYAGDRGEHRWVAPHRVALEWRAVASANWHATARWLALHAQAEIQEGGALLVDIGSTTTDLIALRGGQIASRSGSDAERLASGELVYQGVVRTPLCALAPRIVFGAEQVNVMNEFFATTADVYRLTGELDPAHDLHPSADEGAKDLPATRQRLARMIGRDAFDAADADWLALARHWREAQLGEIAGQLQRVAEAAGLAPDAPLIAAGCGDFLAAELAQRSGRAARAFADTLPFADAVAAELLRGGAQLCAPAAAVALLAARA